VPVSETPRPDVRKARGVFPFPPPWLELESYHEIKKASQRVLKESQKLGRVQDTTEKNWGEKKKKGKLKR